MARTAFRGPIASGTIANSEKSDGTFASDGNQGLVLLTQTGTVDRNATLTSDLTFTLPKNSQIVNFFVDTVTAYDSATSATLSIGTSSGDTTYASGLNAKTAGRLTYTPSAAQAGAIADIGTTNLKVWATVTSVGQPTVGSVRVTVAYVQTK